MTKQNIISTLKSTLIVLPCSLLWACTVAPHYPERHYDYTPPPPLPPMQAVQEPPPVISGYFEHPDYEPEPVYIPIAPPPALVEYPSQRPSPDAVWVGGNWIWHGQWVWDHGRWERPPHEHYHWEPTYYEHRDGNVLFVAGHWAEEHHHFEPPSRDQKFQLEKWDARSRGGVAPEGREGSFVPSPPGSRPGLIVPAPVGTHPSSVIGAPPITRPGME